MRACRKLGGAKVQARKRGGAPPSKGGEGGKERKKHGKGGKDPTQGKGGKTAEPSPHYENIPRAVRAGFGKFICLHSGPAG